MIEWGEHPKILEQLRASVQKFSVGYSKRIRRDDGAKRVWENIYQELSERPAQGFIDGLLARDANHICKLAAIYAALDLSDVITAKHLRAAKAIFDYSEKTVRWAFDGNTGNKLANRVLWEIERSPDGMSRSMIEHAALPRHSPAVLLNQVTELLVRAGMITPSIKEFSSGRKVTFWKKSAVFGTPLPTKKP